MPTYSYVCKDCGHSFDIQQAFTDDALTTCPTCDGTLRKVFSAVGVVFKGSGFYRTDSRSGSEKGSGSAHSSGNSSDKPSSAEKPGTSDKSAGKDKSGASPQGTKTTSASGASSSTSSAAGPSSSTGST